jgi:uncharacterized protein YndB with AHSA1/START domain
VRRVLHAPIEEVFAAWVEPDKVARWMAPRGSAEMTAELRPGGAFRLIMADANFRVEHSGEYRTIEPPYLLVFTWRSRFTGMRDTLVTVRLRELAAGQTELQLTHDLASQDEATSHEEGWTLITDRLAAFLVVGPT